MSAFSVGCQELGDTEANISRRLRVMGIWRRMSLSLSAVVGGFWWYGIVRHSSLLKIDGLRVETET